MRSQPFLALALASTLALVGCPPAEPDRRGAGPADGAVPPPTMPAAPRGREVPSADISPVAVASPDEPDVVCSCEQAREDNGWCEACGKGYVAGDEVGCAVCAAAAADSRGGWCEAHDQGYLFRAPSDCPACVRAAAGVSGWCQAHGMGFLQGEKTKCPACAKQGARCSSCDSG